MSKSYNFTTLHGVKDALDTFQFIRPTEITNYIQGPPHVTQGKYIPFNLNIDNAFPLFINNELTSLPDISNTDKDGVISVKMSPNDTQPYNEIVADFVIKKGICSNLAETVYAKLRHLMEYNLDYKKREQLYSWTFSDLATNYTARIKSKPEFRDLELFPYNASIDKFRRLFIEFIEDRNLYTHGQITVLRNNQSICIKNIDRNALKVRYFEIQEAHFSFFSLAFATIDSCLNINSKSRAKSNKQEGK